MTATTTTNDDDDDPYSILGFIIDLYDDDNATKETTTTTTMPSQLEIKKRFRRLALKLHPDKRPASERDVASVEFERARKAYETLSNPVEREKVDATVRARRRRRMELAKESERRSALRERLEEREKRGEEKGREEEEKERKKRKLARELEVLREKYEKENTDEKETTTGERTSSRQTTTGGTTLDARRALKAAWRKPQNPAKEKDHDSPSLFRAFEKYNAVDVIFREIADAKKRKKKGSAFVICETREDAIRASEAKDGIEGEGGRPQVFVTLAKSLASEDAEKKKLQEETEKQKAQQHKQHKQKVPPSKTEDFEKDVLARMRKIAEERKKEKADAAAAQA
jgi:curved DNA-binding protein CbpA